MDKLNQENKIDDADQKIPDTSGLVKKTDYNVKIASITGLLTTAAFNAVENKIPSFSDLVEKTDYNTKILEHETKYLTTSNYNRFTAETLEAKIKEKGLINKSNIFNLVNRYDLNAKLVTLATKAELKAGQDKRVKLRTFDSSYFSDKRHFQDDRSQNYCLLRIAPTSLWEF